MGAWESLTTGSAASEPSFTLNAPPCTATCWLASFVEAVACEVSGRGGGGTRAVSRKRQASAVAEMEREMFGRGCEDAWEIKQT